MQINYLLSKHFFLFISICSFLLCFAQCKSSPKEAFKVKGGLRVLVGLDESVKKAGGESVEIRNQVMEVLGKRIGNYGITPHIAWLEDENSILLEIPGIQEPERVLNLLQSNANLEFWETYNLTDIYSQLVDVDEHLAQILISDKKQELSSPVDDDSLSYEAYEASHPLFAKLQIDLCQTAESYALVSGPVIGYAEINDIDQVTEYLTMDEIKLILPFDIVFRWAAKSIDEDIYELYALKKTTREGVELDGSVITEAKADSDNQGAHVIYLQMNNEGARQWARLTKDNIGKCISMVVDDKVYSAPLVHNEITGGRSMISGQFTKEEALDMANVLNTGRMPVSVKVVSHEIVSPITK